MKKDFTRILGCCVVWQQLSEDFKRDENNQIITLDGWESHDDFEDVVEFKSLPINVQNQLLNQI